MKSADQPATEVVVALSGQSKDAANEVFSVLRTAFACDRAADDTPEDVSRDRPTVWIATFDVAGPGAARNSGGPAGPVNLAEPVTATLQGGYNAVENLREALSSAFAVRVVGTASGDQEEEVQLLLDSSK